MSTRIVKTFDGSKERTDGVVTFVSWDRLRKILKRDGEVRPEEKVIQIVADQDGITISLVDLDR